MSPTAATRKDARRYVNNAVMTHRTTPDDPMRNLHRGRVKVKRM